MEEGKIYEIFNMVICEANKKFSSIKSDFCIKLIANSQVFLHNNQDFKISNVNFDFTLISQIKNWRKGELLDVWGIFYKKIDSKEIFTNRGRTNVWNITIIDNSLNEKLQDDEALGVSWSIFGKTINELKFINGEIYAFKKWQTNTFRGGIQLNISMENVYYWSNTLMQIKECVNLLLWFQSVGNK
jgi:hypothetical protein